MCHVAGGGGTGERWGGALRAVFTTQHAPLPVDPLSRVLGAPVPGTGSRRQGVAGSELGPARGVEKPREEEWLRSLCSE